MSYTNDNVYTIGDQPFHYFTYLSVQLTTEGQHQTNYLCFWSMIVV